MSKAMRARPRNTLKEVTTAKAVRAAKSTIEKQLEAITEQVIQQYHRAMLSTTLDLVLGAMVKALTDKTVGACWGWSVEQTQHLIDEMMLWIKPISDGDVTYEEFQERVKEFLVTNDLQIEEV